MFSDMPRYGKALALVAFFAIMTVWALAWGGLVSWLPPRLSSTMGWMFLAFCAGWLLCSRYGRER